MTQYTRDRYADELEEERSEQVRMARPTFSTEHGGRLSVNDLVDVGPSTKRRWLRLGIAVDGTAEPFEAPADPGATPEQLRAEIARLQAMIEAQERAASGPQVAIPPNPFEAPTALPQRMMQGSQGGPYNLTSGAQALGDVKPTGAPEAEDEEEEEEEGDGESPNTARRRAARRGE